MLPWATGFLAMALACMAPLRAQGPYVPWPGAGFPLAEMRHVPAREIYPSGRPGRAGILDATVVFDRRSPWTQGRALRQLRKTAAILEHCGVAFGKVVLARVEFSRGFKGFDAAEVDPATGVPAEVVRLASLLPQGTARPVAFLIRAVRGTDSLAVSYGPPEAARSKPAYADTAWLSYRSHWLPRRDPDYSPVAHEFAHLLCRCGHAGGPSRHLLHKARNFLGSSVLPEDCARIRESSLVQEEQE